MLRLSYYSLLWKFVQIIMVPKPGKPIYDVTSYQPISLLPIPTKIFEKILLKSLRSDVDLSALLPDYHFGFQAGHSTIHQTHRIVHEIAKSLERKRLCTAVFLDVTQAFDKVWHTGLLYKIKTKLPGPYYLLFKSYLHTRFFQVQKFIFHLPRGVVRRPTTKCPRTLALLMVKNRIMDMSYGGHRNVLRICRQKKITFCVLSFKYGKKIGFGHTCSTRR